MRSTADVIADTEAEAYDPADELFADLAEHQPAPPAPATDREAVKAEVRRLVKHWLADEPTKRRRRKGRGRVRLGQPAAPAPQSITIQMPAPRPVVRVVERDENGLITRISEVPADVPVQDAQP